MGKQLLVDTYTGVLTPKKTVVLPKGIVLQVEGPFGVIGKPNKNNREYPKELWEKVISNPEVQEKFKMRNCYGEADHPQTLTASLQRASHIVTGLGLRQLQDGREVVWGEADVFDTPSGRILKTLFDAKCAVGISSRGAGSLLDGATGNKNSSRVNSEDYVYGGHDFVADPACEGSYPSPRSESVKKQVVSVLTESVEVMDEVRRDREYLEGVIKHHIGEDVVKMISEVLDPKEKEDAEKAGLEFARKREPEFESAEKAYVQWANVTEKQKETAEKKAAFVAAFTKEKNILKTELAKAQKESLNQCFAKAEIIAESLVRGSRTAIKEKSVMSGKIKELEGEVGELGKRCDSIAKERDAVKDESRGQALLANKLEVVNEKLISRVSELRKKSVEMVEKSLYDEVVDRNRELCERVASLQENLQDIDGAKSRVESALKQVQGLAEDSSAIQKTLMKKLDFYELEIRRLKFENFALSHGIKPNELEKVAGVDSDESRLLEAVRVLKRTVRETSLPMFGSVVAVEGGSPKEVADKKEVARISTIVAKTGKQ